MEDCFCITSVIDIKVGYCDAGIFNFDLMLNLVYLFDQVSSCVHENIFN